MINNYNIKITVFLLLLIGTSQLSADYLHFDFSEPGSGRKVHSYQVDLNFDEQNLRRYEIPNDCAKIINEVTFGSPAPNSVLDRTIWFKVINDCRYVTFLHQNEERALEQDFVSHYDFFNARLEDLPFESHCEEGVGVADCKTRPASAGKLKLSAFFPFLEIVDYDGQTPVEECRFHDGAFRGELMLTAEGIRCHQNSRARGLRLLTVDYADLNQDGYEDALLRMMPLGRSVSRMPIMLPLTRFSADEPFSLPADLSVDLYMAK